MSLVRRYDTAPLGSVERLDTGGIRVPATLSRTGVQEYRGPDGSIRREYRPASEVFAPEALLSARGATVTNRHPVAGRVDTKSWRTLAVGYVGEDVRQDDDQRHVRASVYIHDADTIEEIEALTLTEVSLGYDTEYDPTPGVSPDGEPYDGVQTRIRVNHAALVPKGRAGSARLVLDNADDQIPPETVTVKIKISGKEYDAASPEATAALAALESAASRADAACAEVSRLRCDAVRASVARLKDAPRLREDAGESEIMVETLKKIAPSVDVADKSPEYIAGAFAAALALRLEIEATPEEEPSEEEEAAPGAPPGPSPAAVRADAIRARQVRSDEDRIDAVDDDESPAERARLAMIKAGRRSA